MMPLDKAFLSSPLAHRGFHDLGSGRVENSRSAFAAAIEAGFGIELDVQLSSDGHAVVFHDDRLDRLTSEKGDLRDRSASELSQITLTGSNDRIERLTDILKLVAGRAPLLIEIKDQSRALTNDGIGPLEASVADALAFYGGPVAVMSFNPHAVRAFRRLGKGCAIGLTTCAFRPLAWRGIDRQRLGELAAIPDFRATGASFISHDVKDLSSGRVVQLKAQGVPVLCWTVRSAREEARAREIADNVTFENYVPARRTG